jgi:hypothetical protein
VTASSAVKTDTAGDASGLSYSGHPHVVGELPSQRPKGNRDADATLTLKGSDGSIIVGHEVQHVSMNASGDVTATFDKMRLTCG